MGESCVTPRRAVDIGIVAVCRDKVSHQGDDKSGEESHVRSGSVGKRGLDRNAEMA